MDRCYKQDCNCTNWHRKRWKVTLHKVEVFEYELYSWQMEHDSYGAASAEVDSFFHMDKDLRKRFNIKARVKKVSEYWSREGTVPSFNPKRWAQRISYWFKKGKDDGVGI